MPCAAPGVTATGAVWCWWSCPTTPPSWTARAARPATGRSRLSALVREVDTVCRTAETRFAVLVEGPEDLRLLGQHIVAKGLERVPLLPPDLTLRFRLVSAALPDEADGSPDDGRLMERLNHALDRLADDPRKVVLHLPQRA